MRILDLDSNTKSNILEDLLKRSPNQYEEYTVAVNKILEDVKMIRIRLYLLIQSVLIIPF